MQTESDAALVQHARDGDKRAFGELITRHQTMAQRVARQMVRDEERARDLAQEALLAAYLSLDQLRDDERFASWLYGITLNVCRSHLRDRKVTTFSFEEIAGGVAFEAIPFSSETDPQTLTEARELHERVLDAVNALSQENRAATLLFYYDGLTLDEIATLLHISVGAVKGRLHKSRARLRQELFAVYADYARPERSKKMIPVTVADVVRREHKDEQGNVFPNHIVVLYDAQGQRTLPIWVGPFEGTAIALGVVGEAMPRPMTFEFMVKLIAAANATVESVRVDSLQGDVFFAVVTLRQGDRTVEIDARPSDAIALAVRMKSPIFASEAVMEKAGIAVPLPIEIHSPPRGLEQLTQIWQQEYLASRALSQRSEEEWKQSQRELVELVFGK